MKTLLALIIITMTACNTTQPQYVGVKQHKEGKITILGGHYVDRNGIIKPFYLPN